jgi:hypothetical protein
MRVVFALCAVIFASQAIAEELAKTYDFTGQIGTDGRLMVLEKGVPIKPSSGTDALEALKGVKGALQVDDLSSVWASQEFFLKKNEIGNVVSIYANPVGSLPMAATENLSPGWALEKAEPAYVMASFFPEKSAVKQELTDFFVGVRDTVCDFPIRPTTFKSTVDISPAWGAVGKINFEAEWKAEDLCKTPEVK